MEGLFLLNFWFVDGDSRNGHAGACSRHGHQALQRNFFLPWRGHAELRHFQPHEYVSVEYWRQEVLQFSVAPPGQKKVSLESLMAMAGAGSGVPIPGVAVNKPKIQEEEPLHAELRSFVDSVRNRTTPLVPLEDGRKALAVAMNILSAIEEHSRQAQLHSL